MEKDLLDLSCWGEEVCSNLIRAMITQKSTREIAISISPDLEKCYNGIIEATTKSIVALFMSHPFWDCEQGLFGFGCVEFWKDDQHMMN